MINSMKALLTKSPIGYFAFSKEGDLLYYQLLEKDVNKAVKALENDYPHDFLKSLKDYDIVKDSKKGYEFLRKQIRQTSIDLNYFENEKEFNDYFIHLGQVLTRKDMKSSIQRDKLVINASNALDEVNEMYNKLMERLTEWFSLHYPESNAKGPKLFNKIIKYQRRENFPDFENSTGIELTKEDEEIIVSFAKTAKKLYEEKKELENYIKSAMKDVALNVSSIINPLIGAKLLAAAGSMKKMARMTSSTIQLLGAEKALFRHLKKQGKSPKFGLIFNTKYIQNAERDRRGKIARIISSKLMMASRIDFYSKRDERDRLNKELKEDIEKL